MLDDHKYFIAEREGLTFLALQKLEEVGSQIVNNLGVIDAKANDLSPIRILSGQEALGLTVLPKEQIYNPIALASLRGTLEQKFKNISAIMLESKVGVVAIPYLDVRQVLSSAPEMLNALGIIAEALPDLEVGPNILTYVAQFVKDVGVKSSFDPEKTVLSVNGKISYPMARKVFADWVVRMPPHIPVFGEDFVPPEFLLPDTRLITSSELKVLRGDVSFEEFKHDHEKARKRILEWQKMDVARIQPAP